MRACEPWFYSPECIHELRSVRENEMNVSKDAFRSTTSRDKDMMSFANITNLLTSSRMLSNRSKI